MKHAVAALAVVVSVLAGPAQAGDALSFDKAWLTPNAGTLGIGLEGGYRWNEHWGARVGVNVGGVNFVYHDKNSDLHNRLMLLSTGATADYYPFAGDFRLSAGMRVSASKINGDLANLKKHGKNYTITITDPLTKYTVRQNTFQPYIGAGYSVEIKEQMSLNVDFGALYAGTPRLSVRSRAERYGFTEEEINNEIERQRDRIAPFQVYPVVQIGLNVRF